MTTATYDIHTDVKYGPLQLVEAGKLADGCPEKWWNQSLCQVNDSVARGVVHRTRAVTGD